LLFSGNATIIRRGIDVPYFFVWFFYWKKKQIERGEDENGRIEKMGRWEDGNEMYCNSNENRILRNKCGG
jgi:hypothetical protein